MGRLESELQIAHSQLNEDCGLRIADCGLRIADFGLQISDCGLWIFQSQVSNF